MRTVLSIILVGSIGCATDPTDPTEPPVVTDPTDDDDDGISDQLEDQIMERFGPELRLPPDDIDQSRPANVDWYLPQVHMRFDQSGCPDDAILDLGAITFDNIHEQQNFKKDSGTGLCARSDDPADQRFSNQKHLEFFLQAVDGEVVHAGISPANQDEWRVYIQVRPSGYVRADGLAAAYDLQVWYFFPFNDFVATANHEADWEHVTVSVTAELELVSVFFATHDEGHRIDDATQLQLVDETHVVGYIADGSHATYDKVGAFPVAVPVVMDHTYDGGPVWTTWTNFVNLGQTDHILDGQTWARYGGRWGEVGETAFTSGPPGPMFNSKWDTANEY
jgi:hypothetical protein